jgi:hypothetical protein
MKLSLKQKYRRVPITRNAWLISEGIPTPTPTKHLYKETKQRGDAYHHIYTCLETGKDRTWGVDEIYDSGDEPN